MSAYLAACELEIIMSITSLKYIHYLLFFAICAIGCFSNRKIIDELPCIDVRKTYPEKEINITDIANVSYIHLNTDDDEYLYKGRILCVTQNTFVVYDQSSFSILFFSRNGVPKSRFNRFGQGPEEYWGADRILFDEETDDVFICNTYSDINYVQVYSSTGEYKRKITLPQNAMMWSLVSFDNQSLFVFAENFHYSRLTTINRKSNIPYTTYYRISKSNGKILDSLQLISNEVELTFQLKEGGGSWITNYYRFVKCVDGFFLCNPETDTVFHYTGGQSLTPVLHKIPLARNQDPKVVIPNIVDSRRYQFFEVQTLFAGIQSRLYFLDKETGEIFRQKLISHDFKGKEFNICVSLCMTDTGDVNGYIFELGLYELKEAYKENRLSGKLKELVATLNEDEDNNVFMMVEFM